MPRREQRFAYPTLRRRRMYIQLEPVLSLLAGIVILAVPKMLNYTIGIYLLVVGVLGLIP